MKSFLRWLLWKLSGRDYLVLRPGWKTIHLSAAHTVLGPEVPARLPVSYNFHTPREWNLGYQIQGEGRGRLTYRLSAPGKSAFFELNVEVQLPSRLTVLLERDQFRCNGQLFPLLPGATLPVDTAWLTAKFTFQPAQGAALRRRTGHRVLSPVLDSDGAYYQGAVYDDYELKPGMVASHVLEAVARHRALSGRFLDVGSATGLLVQAAAARGLVAEGVDHSAWAVARANEKCPGSCRVLDFDRAERSDFGAAYDVIVLHSVLEHLADPARALRLLQSLTVPGGLVYLQTLNAGSFMHKLCGENWSGFSDPTHRSPWITAEWLAENAVTAGFEVRQIKRYGIWNENTLDDVWRDASALWAVPPANVLLEEQGGDFLEAILISPLHENRTRQ